MAKQTILIIEDDPDLVEVVQYNLERESFGVLSAADGEKGLEEALRRRPDLILLDLMLPGLDGLEVCRRLRADEATRAIPIIMLTAKGEEVDVRHRARARRRRLRHQAVQPARAGRPRARRAAARAARQARARGPAARDRAAS